MGFFAGREKKLFKKTRFVSNVEIKRYEKTLKFAIPDNIFTVSAQKCK